MRDTFTWQQGSETKKEIDACIRWLSSLRMEDVKTVQNTQEYRDFLKSMENLHHVHNKSITFQSQNQDQKDEISDLNDLFARQCASFLQYGAADDLVLRVLEFLDCQSLVRLQRTCWRFRDLALRSAQRRTRSIAVQRQLIDVMQLLRAQEQLEGICTQPSNCHVRVPTLLLSRRVEVSNCGDPEYNGVYFCTGCNGNGFVFSKPRFPEQRVERQQTPGYGAVYDSTHVESEVAQSGQLLRCMIAKRFSNETLLWYCSKESVARQSQSMAVAGEVVQIFSFWSKLLVIGDASPDVCRYASQSSILERHQEGWQSLGTTRATQPPTVELFD
jgi:hypothetical protein